MLTTESDWNLQDAPGERAGVFAGNEVLRFRLGDVVWPFVRRMHHCFVYELIPGAMQPIDATAAEKHETFDTGPFGSSQDVAGPENVDASHLLEGGAVSVASYQ